MNDIILCLIIFFSISGFFLMLIINRNFKSILKFLERNKKRSIANQDLIQALSNLNDRLEKLESKDTLKDDEYRKQLKNLNNKLNKIINKKQ